MKPIRAILLYAATAFTQISGQSTFDPVRPPAVPLAVRSPYLNTWLNTPTDGTGEAGYLAGQWPKFWTQSISGWQGFARVDGTSYNWMGAHPGPDRVEQTALKITATRSIFTVQAGGVELSIEFLSPVYTDDLLRQSIVSSYLQVSATSLDGASHDVQLYADVSAEWASGDKSAIVEWEHGTGDGLLFHKFWRQNQDVFNEANDQGSWGNWYWAVGDTDGVTVEVGEDTVVRGRFLEGGVLSGAIDTKFRAVQDRWPVFAFSRDLGQVTAEPIQTLFTIGITQEDSITFQGAGDGPVSLPSYWVGQVNESDIVSVFFNDWGHAQDVSDQLDKKILDDATAAAGQDYYIILSLSVRQSFGALQYTGTPDNVIVWQKEISSNSVAQTVDVLYPTWPFMLYFDPQLIKYTMAPLLENQASGHYPNAYAIHDLGRYPRALGYPGGNDEPMPLEESSNMILMMLSYAQRTNDVAYLETHRALLEQWAEFLIEDAKIPANQLSTDDFAGPAANQTNLAIKGIIGLQAMSEIEKLTGNPDDQARYANTATEYLEYWKQHAISADANPPHSMHQYDKPDSYGLLYNLYADKVLNLSFIPEEIYSMQSTFYPTVKNKYGVILDTRSTSTKLDWEMFAAAVASKETRDMFTSSIAQWIGVTPTYRALTDLFDTKTGNYWSNLQFTARPVVGGAFSLLALP